MRPTVHLVSGILLGGATWFVTKDVGAAAVCGIASVISDTDHVLEYGCYCIKEKRMPQSSEFFSGEYFDKKGTLGVVFHGYEYLIIMFLLALVSSIQGWWWSIYAGAFTIGYGTHMLLDTIGNECTIRGYSIIYRIKVKFDEKIICSRKHR